MKLWMYKFISFLAKLKTAEGVSLAYLDPNLVETYIEKALELNMVEYDFYSDSIND